MSGTAVVIPCFNLGRTVGVAIDSVCQQTRPAAEIIVIDDGSTDTYTRQVLAQASAAGLCVVRTPNRGVAAARNTGVELTSSPYIVLLDADDALEPAYIERLAGLLHDRLELDFVTCGLRAFGEADYVWVPPNCAWPETMSRGGPHITSMFRRSLWKRIGGFDQNLEGYEDTDFWLTALEHDARGEVW